MNAASQAVLACLVSFVCFATVLPLLCCYYYADSGYRLSAVLKRGPGMLGSGFAQKANLYAHCAFLYLLLES